jgi:hypothetical protein
MPGQPRLPEKRLPKPEHWERRMRKLCGAVERLQDQMEMRVGGREGHLYIRTAAEDPWAGDLNDALCECKELLEEMREDRRGQECDGVEGEDPNLRGPQDREEQA